MAAQKGKDLLIKINDGTSFVTVAGLRTRRLHRGNVLAPCRPPLQMR